MALVIVGVNRATSCRQISTDVLVTTAVLREAMHQDGDAFSSLWDPSPTKQQMTGRPGQVSFRSADSGLFQTECALQGA